MSASSALKGSSISSTLGCMARPRATATRWRMPPDSSRGRFHIAGVRLTSSMNSSVMRPRSREGSPALTASTARATLSYTVIQGRSEYC